MEDDRKKIMKCESEYRRNFQKLKPTNNYQNNLDFRYAQKERFQGHNYEPFMWDELDWDSGCEESDCDNRFESKTTKYKHEKLNKLYQERLEKTRQNNVILTPAVDVSKLQISDDDDDDDQDAIKDSVVHVFEPSQNKKHVTIKEPRNESQNQSYLNRVIFRRIDASPFVPYGFKNEVIETGTKMTHNVRAAQQIFPGALRAQRIRRLEGQHLDRHNFGSWKQAYKGAADKPQRENLESTHWMSEYRSNFKRYDAKEYDTHINSSAHHFTDLGLKIPQVLR